MSNEPAVDPLLDALSGLTQFAPRDAHARRVRSRCHAAMAERRASAGASARPLRFPDMAIAGGIAVYVMAVITEAIRLLG